MKVPVLHTDCLSNRRYSLEYQIQISNIAYNMIFYIILAINVEYEWPAVVDSRVANKSRQYQRNNGAKIGTYKTQTE